MSTTEKQGLTQDDGRIRLLLQVMMQTTVDGMVIVGVSDQRARQVNERFSSMCGYTSSELVGMHITAISTKETDREITDRVQRIINDGYELFETQLRRKDGSFVEVEVSASFADVDDGILICLCRDVSERRRTETALSVSEEKYRALFDQAVEGIYLHDAQGRILDVNDMACQQSGYSREELLNRTVFDNFPSTQLPGLLNKLRDEITEDWASWEPGKRVTLEADHQHKDGTVYPVEVTTGVIRFCSERVLLAVVRDITERRKAEETLRNMQKLEALGILAGGIAHDFNNLLSGVYGYIDLAHVKTKERLVAEYLSKAQSTITRARGLTEQLLTFAKGGSPILRSEHLSPFLENTVEFALSGSAVSCNCSVPDNLWPGIYDPNHMGQVIDNLVINAMQAMPTGGTIDVHAENVVFSRGEHSALKAGRYVKIVIQDRGIGIPRAHLALIFDPFYTTKPLGHGLGLSTCFSIVKRHQGAIDVESEPGEGTIVTVYLPASPTPPQRQRIEKMASYRGSGTILVLDDEEVVRDTVRAMFESFGFTVVLREKGEEAIAFVEQQMKEGREIAAMMFDLTIPGGMGGKEAIKNVRKLFDKTPIFVTSGYADDPIMANPRAYGFTASIAKPFVRKDLEMLLKTHLVRPAHLSARRAAPIHRGKDKVQADGAPKK